MLISISFQEVYMDYVSGLEDRRIIFVAWSIQTMEFLDGEVDTLKNFRPDHLKIL